MHAVTVYNNRLGIVVPALEIDFLRLSRAFPQLWFDSLREPAENLGMMLKNQNSIQNKSMRNRL